MSDAENKTEPEAADLLLYQYALSCYGDRFRGEIWENCARFKLTGKGYASMPREQDGHFEIRTARHLAGPLRALRDPNVRSVYIIGATQVMKSVAGDIWLPYIMEHCPRSTLVLFEDDPKALLFCDGRLMDTIYAHPVLEKQIADVDRHDAGKTSIKLPTMMLEVCGLNDGNVSSLSWPNIWSSEAWQHKSDGLLAKAIKRADRFPTTCKILIESQAGEEGEDLHAHSKSAHQVPLTWACPQCGGRQSWECDREYAKLRPDDFQATEKAKPGTYAGMNFCDDPDIDVRARSAKWECYHCGHLIEDKPEIRQQIMDSYEQDYQITGPDGIRFSPKAVCFIIPKEAATGNSFENNTKSYLIAKEAEKSGNKKPLADWYMSERAVFYGPQLTQKPVAIVTSTSSSEADPNERARVFSVDCQQGEIENKTGYFWTEARAIDKGKTEIKQLYRAYHKNWGWIQQYKRLKIPNSNVFVDGGNYLHEILDAAAANYEIVDNEDPRTKKKTPRLVSFWNILIGEGTRKSFPAGDGIYRAFSKPSVYQRQITLPDGSTKTGQISVYYWSNLSVKDHLFNLLSGGPTMPKWTALNREHLDATTQAEEVGEKMYSKQMQNEYRTRVNGKDKWVEVNPHVHYRDTACQCIVAFDAAGHFGLPAVDQDAQSAD